MENCLRLYSPERIVQSRLKPKGTTFQCAALVRNLHNEGLLLTAFTNKKVLADQIALGLAWHGMACALRWQVEMKNPQAELGT